MLFILLMSLLNYVPCCDITLGSVRMTSVASVAISKSIFNITQTAIVEFPKNVYFKNHTKRKLSEVLKTGDKVTIKLGYNNRLNTEFEGYISHIEQSIPIRIHCEDQAFTLKRKTVNPKVWLHASLGDIIDYIAEGVNVNIIDRNIKLGEFQVDRVSPVTVLKYIKDNYPLCCFFKDNVLNVGAPYGFTPQEKVFVYDFQKNVADNNLEYQTTDTSKIVIKAISHLSTGKKLVVWLPYKGAEGDIRTLNLPEMTEPEVRIHGEAERIRFTFNGYRGDVTGFGLPFVQFTEVIRLRDNEFKDREKNYFIDGTEVSFNPKSFLRQAIISKSASGS